MCRLGKPRSTRNKLARCRSLAESLQCRFWVSAGIDFDRRLKRLKNDLVFPQLFRCKIASVGREDAACSANVSERATPPLCVLSACGSWFVYSLLFVFSFVVHPQLCKKKIRVLRLRFTVCSFCIIQCVRDVFCVSTEHTVRFPC